MTPRSAVLMLLGGAVGMVVLEKVTKRKDPGRATPIFVPDAPLPSLSAQGQPQASPSAAPVLVQGDPIPILPGQPYRVTLVTHRGANVASEGQVRAEAQKRGFVNVIASKGKPAGWPGAANGDWFVSATYAGAPRTQARSEGGFLGSVDVVEVWQG